MTSDTADKRNQSYHATVCISATLDESTVPEQYRTPGNDVTHIIVDRFGIDDARTLSVEALQKPVEGTYRVFVIVTEKLPIEAQNALLKLFEEPPLHTRFYMVLPQVGMLIPTLSSRVQIEYGIQESCESNATFTSFLASSYAQRMDIIDTIIKTKDTQSAELLLVGAETYAAKDTLKYTALLRSVVLARQYHKMQGASVKMLLQDVAMSLPKE